MTRVVFFLKATPPSLMKWPPGTKTIVLDPPQKCSGSDPLCSTAYSNLYSSLKGVDGRVLPNLLKKYGVEGAQSSFVSFSAGHGFLNAYLSNDQDRVATDAVLLLDSTFGGGKTGYVKAAKAAAAGGPLFATVTSDKGTTDALNNGDYAFEKFVLVPAGLHPSTTISQPPMPAGATVRKQGNLWYYKYPDAKLHHWDMGKVQREFIEATLVPYWSGKLSTSSSRPIWLDLGLAVLAAGATLWAVSRATKKEDDRGRGANPTRRARARGGRDAVG